MIPRQGISRWTYNRTNLSCVVMPPAHPPIYSLLYRVEFAAARALFSALRLLSADGASAVGGWLGRRIGRFTGANGIAADNLAHALPELDSDARTAALTEAWDNLGRTMAEYTVLPTLVRDDQAWRVTVEGYEPLAALSAAGKPALLFAAHLGNWEVIPVALSRLMKPLTIVYRPANNPLVDGLIARIRTGYTAGMAPKGSAGARQIMRALGAGGHVFMVVDQKLNTGFEIPFFGRGAFTGPAVASFAARFQCPVFPIRTERLAGCTFKVTVEAPWPPPEQNDDDTVRAFLTRMNQTLEAWIRARPGQWLWMHRRWPK